MGFVRKLWRFLLGAGGLVSLILCVGLCIFWVRGHWAYDAAGLQMYGSTYEIFSAGRFGLRHDSYDPPVTSSTGLPHIGVLSTAVANFPLNHGSGPVSYLRQERPFAFGPPSRYTIYLLEVSPALPMALTALWPAVAGAVLFWRRRNRARAGFPVLPFGA